ncbi:xanthine dehydrogenase family protein molybdopterin-binding subunit [Massilia puerhi]|uniref:xanthine dehydrogenase family protein molybdopterin-binding subunit n=1 Tax=Massilia puerhi TaxID=2681550 RepID=UPI00135B2011|nr:xanthine dehydrogenase family protein molybdopterin-binding subunit [Massilia puerhi]
MNDSAFPKQARIDARDKVRGAALYAADQARAGMLHAMLAVSTINRGEVLSIDTRAARAVAGVRLVLTHADMGEYKPAGHVLAGGFAFQGMQPMLAPKIAYRGQPIALVVADTLEAATEAAALIRAKYQELPSQLTLDAPDKDIVPQQGSPLPQQMFADKVAGDADGAFADALHQIDARYLHPAQHQNPIELVSTVAEWRKGTLVIHEGTQNSGAIRHGLARQLGLDPERIEVISPQCGGGFGMKNSLQMQTLLAAVAARRLGQPVKLVVPRSQLFHDASFRPASRHRIRLGADAGGKILAAVHEADQQTSRHDLFPASYAEMTARLYGIPNFRGRERLVRTDVQTPGYMRAPFEQPASFAFESAVDELAQLIGIDPVELRLRNDTQIDVLSGKPLSSRFLAECLREGARRFGWRRRDARPASMKAPDGAAIGWGVACGAYKAATSPAIARIAATSDGRIHFTVAGHEMGQGMRTAIANVLVRQLGVDPGALAIRIGDTRGAPQHLTAGSWGTASVAPAAEDAARALKEALAQLVPGHDRSLRPAQVLALAQRTRIEAEVRCKAPGQPDAVYGRLQGGMPAPAGPVYPEFVSMSYAAHFVEVNVEPVTRRIRVARVVSMVDCGRVVSPVTADSQVRGGVVWGIGAALREISEVDPRYGGFLNADLAEYVLPVHADIGHIEVGFIDRPDPLLNAAGVKGLGEVAMVGVAAAIANAVQHATGQRIRRLPIRIEDVL